MARPRTYELKENLVESAREALFNLREIANDKSLNPIERVKAAAEILRAAGPSVSAGQKGESRGEN